MRVCKNCGKYFAITGRTNAEYCDRVFDSKGRTCKDVGAIAKWTREKDTDNVFKAYRREYKKRFAWTKSGKILPEELYAWGERAREKKTECDSGKISLEEYVAWLKDSYRPLQILYDYLLYQKEPERDKMYTDILIRTKYNIDPPL